MPRVVSFHYTLRDPSGRVIDSSAGGEPITYLEGAGQIIEGLDQQLRNAQLEEKRRVTVPAAQAYGERDPAQIHRIKRTMLPVDGELHVGDQFQTGSDRHAPIVTIAAIEGDDVLIDGNHPLAGVDLTFDVQITAAREANADELRHGHAHGDGCCGGGGGGCGCEG
jgi:FKBP-type peptidyl-prolyl cis-trans isomerase SlyD